jgi:hypothetical protein
MMVDDVVDVDVEEVCRCSKNEEVRGRGRVEKKIVNDPGDVRLIALNVVYHGGFGCSGVANGNAELFYSLLQFECGHHFFLCFSEFRKFAKFASSAIVGILFWI